MNSGSTEISSNHSLAANNDLHGISEINGNLIEVDEFSDALAEFKYEI
jgi:hypothetical protein